MPAVKPSNMDDLYYIIIYDFLLFDWAWGLGERVKNYLGLDPVNLNSICLRGVDASLWELKEDPVIVTAWPLQPDVDYI